MKKIILLFILVFSSHHLFAQYEQISMISFQDSSASTKQAFVIPIDSTTALAVWAEGQFLYSATTSDYGAMWNNKNTISSKLGIISSSPDINLLKLNNGRILLTYRAVYHYARYSDDDGITWSDSIQLHRKRNLNNSSLTQTNDSTIWFSTSRYNDAFGLGTSKISYSLKSEDGILWSETLDTLMITENNHGYPTVFSIDTNTLGLIYQEMVDEKYNIYLKRSSDNGITWSDKELIYETITGIYRPRINVKSNGNLLITFQELVANQIENYKQYDIFFIESENKGVTWNIPTQFTTYIGFDGVHNVSLVEDEPLISFASNRNHIGWTVNFNQLLDIKNVSLWYGIGGLSEDVVTPPVLVDNWFNYEYNYPKTNVDIIAKVFDESSISSVTVTYSINQSETLTLELFDDGLHNDEEANDMIFANRIDSILISDTLFYGFNSKDNQLNTTVTNEQPQKPFYPKAGNTYLVDVNNIKLPIDNKGIHGDVKVTNSNGNYLSGGWFEEARFLFSGGFALSGYTNGQLWANGMEPARRIEHYQPGNVNGSDSTKFVIYVVKSTDKEFGDSWIKWQDAVSLGADFYDGDGDGIYNPIDKNSNGKWDNDEDKPDIIGDATAWCVFNDSVPPEERIDEIGFTDFSDVAPQGIEIKQTVFAYSQQTYPELSNVVFVRYSIENTGIVSDKLDSVYFTAFNDPDLGNYNDDLSGCDTTINSGFVYNNGADEDYGVTPPTFITTILQGPLTFIPNVTFKDNNENNTFDIGVDLPLDTAKTLSGQLLGETFIPGAKNLNMTSFIHCISSHPTQSCPVNKLQLKCATEGLNQECESLNPCDWEFGQVFNMNCEDVNQKFMYSGDPVTQNGWINTFSTDQRMMVNSGPFVLEKDNPVEIITAYIVGRGTDAINSVTVAKDIANDVIGFYNTNFSYIPVGIEDTKTKTIPTKFVLEQNYPNPFNPTTTIKYTIPSSVITTPKRGEISLSSKISPSGRNDITNVRLTIYDILGREVTTLVNKQQKPGNYKVTFDVSNISSGVYFYKLRTGSYSKTKKMILMR